jgi:hypothetical protein
MMGGLSGLDEMELDIMNVRFLTEEGPELRGLDRQGSTSPCQVITELSFLNDVLRYVQMHGAALQGVPIACRAADSTRMYPISHAFRLTGF